MHIIGHIDPGIQHSQKKAQDTVRILDAWDSLINNNSDERGNIKGHNNLTRAEAAGRKEIADGVKNRNWMLYGTDKKHQSLGQDPQHGEERR